MTAGDWIKVRDEIPRSREVSRIARMLKIDRYAALGRVIDFWAWADRNSASGELGRMGLDDIDFMFDAEGFGAAMVEVGWLKVVGEGVAIPGFERHMGKSAKRRALQAEHAARARSGHKNAEIDSASTDRRQDVDSRVDLEEEEERERERERAARARCSSARAREASPDQEPDPDPAPELRGPLPTEAPPGDPRDWDPGSPAKRQAWADWVAHLRGKDPDSPPSRSQLSKHWHRLLAWTDDQAVAVVDGAISCGTRTFSPGVVRRALDDLARAGPKAGAILRGPGSSRPADADALRAELERLWRDVPDVRAGTRAWLEGQLERLPEGDRRAALRRILDGDDVRTAADWHAFQELHERWRMRARSPEELRALGEAELRVREELPRVPGLGGGEVLAPRSWSTRVEAARRLWGNSKPEPAEALG